MGERDAAAGALEERGAEIALQLLDRLGDRRLGDGKLARGAGDRADLGDGDEVLELAELEGHRPRRLACPGSLRRILGRRQGSAAVGKKRSGGAAGSSATGGAAAAGALPGDNTEAEVDAAFARPLAGAANEIEDDVGGAAAIS